MPELIFKGKEFVYNYHLSVPFRPLVPHATKSIGDGRLDGNLIIHGDNLHALKALLPMHAGEVDCVFIDPPYNTGNEGWCYNDNVNSPMMREWLNNNPVGIEDGLRHDKWCAMMYPRLRLLHELLADNGSFWMTLDDNEIHRGRAILDDIFGERNFVATVIWQKKYSTKSDTRFLSAEHDYLLIYAKDIDSLELDGLERTEEQDASYKNPDNDPRDLWTSGDLLRMESRDYAIFEIVAPNGSRYLPPAGSSWRFNKDKIDELIADNRIWFGEGGDSRPRLKRFLKEVRDSVPAQTIWKFSDVGHSDSAKKELQTIMEGAGPTFATPKPVGLLERVLRLIGNKNALVLDSFAGSGTTAHAVLSSNQRDGGHRKFVLVECEEYAERLTAERMRRVINGYAFSGNKREDLLREKLTFTSIKKASKLLEKIAATESHESHRFDKFKKEVKYGELIVFGEKTVEERVEGLGGSFTFCTLGEPLELDRLLIGETLPSFEALGSVLFHMATNQAFNAAQMFEAEGYGYLGESRSMHVWLIYKPDLDFLKSRDAALTLAKAMDFVQRKPDKRHLVFAPARFVGQKMLNEANLPVEFAPLPFALYRIERG
jgi:adenine-specific DNA-methyltransferase